MAYYNQVSLSGFHHEPFHLTMNVTGVSAGEVSGSANVVGKAVSLDTTADNAVKLAGDGDEVIGILRSFERRTVEGTVVGAVEFRFADVLPMFAGTHNIVRGCTVVGAGGGTVKARRNAGNTANENDHNRNFVAEIRGTNCVVVKF